MGALATTGGAVVALGTLSAAHLTQDVASAAVPEPVKHAVAQTATTFSADTYAPSTSLGRLLDELGLSLHPGIAQAARVAVPRVPNPLVAAQPDVPASFALAAQVVYRMPPPLTPVPSPSLSPVTPVTPAMPAGASAAPEPVADAHAVNLAAPVASTQPQAPLAFIWNARYFQLVAPANKTFDATDMVAARERAVRSTIKYLMDEEHMDDFGVDNVTIRSVSQDTDLDLLHVNAGARWVSEVAGVTGTGASMSFPVVLNTDGSGFVDPRVHV